MGTINSTVAFDSHNSGWIEGPLTPTMQVLSASLPNVDSGTIVEVGLSGSAKGAAPMAVRVDAAVSGYPISALA
jgi:hypothetical protein